MKQLCGIFKITAEQGRDFRLCRKFCCDKKNKDVTRTYFD